jgi:two-component system, OmpR family, sensor histidine kinase AdeS
MSAGEAVRFDRIVEEYNLYPSPTLESGVLLGLAAVVLVLTAAAGFYLARRYGRPIASVADAARRVAAGDLGARAESVRGGGARELVELAEHFNSMAASLERTERARRESLAAIAHELRTPLTVMQGRLQGLVDGVFAHNPSEYRRLIAQTELLGRVVEDLRTVTLADAGRLELSLTPVMIEQVIAEAVELCGPRLAAAGIAASTNVMVGRPVLADRQRLVQAISAILDNAVRYAPNSGGLSISAVRSLGRIVIRITDRGPGIDERHLEDIFEPFWRADSSRSRELGGSGLGLAVVKAIMHAHGGTASAHRTGPYTTLELSLPFE